MYRNLLEILREYVGEKAEYVVAMGLVALAVAVLLQLLPPWRCSVREAREGRGWRSVLLALANGLMVLVVGAAIVAALGASMLHQSREFRIRHGNQTEANKYAVRTNWGMPHEQRELSVSHSIEKVRRFLVFEETGREIEIEGDERPPGVGTEGGPTLVTRTARENVPQNSIVSADVRVDLTLTYLQKGSAYYTGYEDEWTLAYLVRNRSDKATRAAFRFPMPADQGTYDDFTVRVDGQDWRENLVRSDTDQTWTMPMEPGQEAKVEVHYRSRGMDFVRYKPAYMAQRASNRMVLSLRPDPSGLGPQRLHYTDFTPPVGGMSPTNREALLAAPPTEPGDAVVMEWDLKDAATTLGMGTVLPEMTQPGAYASRLLHEAPWGLALMAGVLVFTWVLLERREYLLSLGVLAGSTFLFYTLTAYLSEHWTSFTACFAVAAGATLAVSLAYLFLGWGRTFASAQTAGLVLIFTLYYPLAAILDDYTSLMLQVLYWALLAYAAMLVVGFVWRQRQGEPASRA